MEAGGLLALLLAPLRGGIIGALTEAGFPKKMLTLTPRVFVEVALSLRPAYLIRTGQNSTPFSINDDVRRQHSNNDQSY